MGWKRALVSGSGSVLILALAMPATAAAGAADATAPAAARVVAAAVDFRMLAVADPAKAVARFKGADSLGFLLRDAAGKKRPQAWSSFFAASFVIGGNLESPRPVLAFYSPFYDAALLTLWSAGAEGERIVAAAFARGSDLDCAATAAVSNLPAAWIGSGRTPPVALARATQAFIRDFEARYPPGGTAVAPLALSAAGAAHLNTMLEHAALNIDAHDLVMSKANRAVGDKVAAFLLYLARGDRQKLAARIPRGAPLTVDRMLEIAPEVRENLVPVYTAITEYTCLVFVAAPKYPQFLGVLEVAADAGGWSIRSFRFCDLLTLR